MRRSYKFLLKPTVKQQRLLTEMLGDFCDLYNGALENSGYKIHADKNAAINIKSRGQGLITSIGRDLVAEPIIER